MIISRPSSPLRVRLVRASAARRIASGSFTRSSVNARYRSWFVAPEIPFAAEDVVGIDVTVATPFVGSDIGNLSQQGLDLVGRWHGGLTFTAGADNCAGGVAESQNGFQIPAGQQTVAERATKTVTGAETVDHRYRRREHLDHVVPGHPENSLGALFDDGQLDSGVEQSLCRPHRFGFADRNLAFLFVPDGNGDIRQGRPHLARGLFRVLPEHRPVIQIQDGMRLLGASRPGGVVGGSARV